MNTIKTTDTFAQWFAALRDARARVRIQMRIDRAEDGNFGDCKPVEGGVSELRIDYGPGYRVYFTMHSGAVVLLLAGGNKRTQKADIKAALKLAHDIGS